MNLDGDITESEIDEDDNGEDEKCSLSNSALMVDILILNLK